MAPSPYKDVTAYHDVLDHGCGNASAHADYRSGRVPPLVDLDRHCEVSKATHASLVLVPTPSATWGHHPARPRALSEADVVVADGDTRVSGRLLQHLGLQKPLVSFHTHSRHRTVEGLVERLQRGERIALVSDAGTPASATRAFCWCARRCWPASRGVPAGSHGLRARVGGERSALRTLRVRRLPAAEEGAHRR